MTIDQVSHQAMPALTNPRHERFARAFMKTGVAARAYRKAGYENTSRTSLDTCASRLLRHVQVKQRIRELKRQMASRNRITVDSLVGELDEARAQALTLDQPATAVSATMSKAKLVGLLVDRKEHGQPGDFAKELTAEGVLALVATELGEETAAALRAALAAQEATPAAPEPEAVVLWPTDGTVN